MSRNRRVTSKSERILSFEERDNGTGLSVVDYVERRRCEVYTKSNVFPQRVSDEEFHLPIDRAVEITVKDFSIPHTVTAHVRDRRGTLIEDVTKDTDRAFPRGYYQIELTAPIKLYIVVETAFRITVTADEVMIVLDEETEIQLGARSNHDRPAATITTSDDPEDLMRAISMFGSALKTTTCERSYPTLRGHPPRIERGKRFAVPEALDAPDTGIKIEVPPEHESVYPVTSLAYYLGADVVPGSNPRMVSNTGFVHILDDSRRFEKEVERVLKQVFFFDCVIRTEGYYPVDLHERTEIENEVPFDLSALYGRPLTEQVETYLGVPYEDIKPYLPRWKLTAHVEPKPAQVEALPYLMQDLATVHSKEAPTYDNTSTDHTSESLGIKKFLRGDDNWVSEESGASQVVRLQETDALEDVWIGNGAPLGVNKGMIEGFQNRLDRTPSDGDIDITVVVNDQEMIEEGHDVNEVYGSREHLPFDVTIFQQLTAEEFLDVLCKDTDFLHYIGHVHNTGFQCVDDMLDVRNIDTVGVDAFFLNACDSYQQGKRLIESGAIAGVTTLTSVPNQEAKNTGKKLARLLNLGFPLFSAVDIATIGQTHDYVVIGDGRINIVQPTGRDASLCEIEAENGEYNLTYITRTTEKCSIGSITKPLINENAEYFLTSGDTGEFLLTKNDVEEITSTEVLPIIIGSELYFTNNCPMSESVFEILQMS